MNILDALKQLRDDIKVWVTNNLNALNAKIDEKTIPIDSELSSTSTNPVQNKAVKKAIDNIPRFSGNYNDLTDAPNITEDDSGNMVIADESGNIIFKADADGIHTTAVSLNGEAAASEKYVDEAIANIDIPEADFTGYATEDFVNTAIDSAKEELGESIVSESSDWKIVDEAGNIIFGVDNTGAHATDLTINGESILDLVNSTDADTLDGKHADEFALVTDLIETINFYVCSEGEYSEDNIPTIVKPDKNTFYLIPQDEQGISYASWVYKNNTWEFVEVLTISLDETEGSIGKNGLSAYEIAVENGFSGSEQQWLKSLKGTNGKTPEKGVDYFTSNDIQEVAQVAADLVDISSEITQEQELIDMLVSGDMLPAFTDSTNSIFIDKNNTILSW